MSSDPFGPLTGTCRFCGERAILTFEACGECLPLVGSPEWDEAYVPNPFTPPPFDHKRWVDDVLRGMAVVEARQEAARRAEASL